MVAQTGDGSFGNPFCGVGGRAVASVAAGRYVGLDGRERSVIRCGHARVYRVKAYELPEAPRDGHGQHLANLLAMQPDERVVEVLALRDYNAAPYLVLATRIDGATLAVLLRRSGWAGDARRFLGHVGDGLARYPDASYGIRA